MRFALAFFFPVGRKQVSGKRASYHSNKKENLLFLGDTACLKKREETLSKGEKRGKANKTKFQSKECCYRRESRREQRLLSREGPYEASTSFPQWRHQEPLGLLRSFSGSASAPRFQRAFGSFSHLHKISREFDLRLPSRYGASSLGRTAQGKRTFQH